MFTEHHPETKPHLRQAAYTIKRRCYVPTQNHKPTDAPLLLVLIILAFTFSSLTISSFSALSYIGERGMHACTTNTHIEYAPVNHPCARTVKAMRDVVGCGTLTSATCPLSSFMRFCDLEACLFFSSASACHTEVRKETIPNSKP